MVLGLSLPPLREIHGATKMSAIFDFQVSLISYVFDYFFSSIIYVLWSSYFPLSLLCLALARLSSAVLFDLRVSSYLCLGPRIGVSHLVSSVRSPGPFFNFQGSTPLHWYRFTVPCRLNSIRLAPGCMHRCYESVLFHFCSCSVVAALWLCGVIGAVNGI